MYMRKKLRIQSEQERDNRYLEQSYNLLATAYNDVPYPALKSVQTIIDKVAEDEPKVKERDVKSFVDDSSGQRVRGQWIYQSALCSVTKRRAIPNRGVSICQTASRFFCPSSPRMRESRLCLICIPPFLRGFRKRYKIFNTGN